MPWHLTLDYDTYEEARAAFEWDVPEGYNAAYDLVRKHEDPDAPALYQAPPDGGTATYTFRDLDRLSDRMAAGLAALGVGFGDRVGVVVPQKPQNPIAHLACWKLGAVSVPLSVLFGRDGLSYRLDDSGARVVVADESVAETAAAAREECADLEHVVTVRGDGTAVGDGPSADSGATAGGGGVTGAEDGAHTFESVLAEGVEDRPIADTDADTPLLILYTSGSTGPPKGVLHTHDLWVAHCPAFYMYFERNVFDSTFFTPADWAWIGALGDLVFPAWHYGRPIVGSPVEKFDREWAFELCERFDVTDAFLPPTAIRMMMTVDDPTERYDLSLSAICTGGEPLTPEILEWAEEELSGVAVNELYGQTEANLLVANCRDWFEARAGSMGKPVPGHDVAVVDDDGEELPPGELGDIAVRREGDPVVFAEYWNRPEKTEAVRRGAWHVTGDLGERDADGYLWFKARDDDVIITAGYRVGPGEVESAVLEHPDVEQVGVVGIPDETRGEIIKAFVQPVEGVAGDDDLRAEIREMVKRNLAKHEYPREIEFVDELPQTTTGKIQRRKLREREDAEDRGEV